MTPTSNDDTTATHANQLDYDSTEDAIDIVQEDVEDLADQVGTAFSDDVDDIEDRLEQLEDTIDDAQDDEGTNPLGAVPAQLDYLQRAVAILQDQTDVDAASDVAAGLEAIEEEIEAVAITKTQWYAQVDGVPEVYSQQEVASQQLKQQGDIQGDTEAFTVKALPTPTADLSDSEANFPEDDQPVDLEEFTYFRTEKVEGGVV